MYGSDSAIGLLVILVLVIVGGAVSGFVALVKARRLDLALEDLRKQILSLRKEISERPSPIAQKEAGAPVHEEEITIQAAEEEIAIPPQPPPVAVTEPSVVISMQKESVPSRPPLAPDKAERKIPPPPSSPSVSLEMKLGTKWLNWVGIVMLLGSIGFFLKYAYDNAWIGPGGRLAIGTLLGIIALVLGERFRRRDWSILFQVLTGGSLAIFYLCVFFSFQVYHLADQTLSMILAILVTALAVVMAVAHNALPIAILAIIGGFLSPVLLSTGTNHPYALFTYIAILDMVSLGVAYFRRWRALDLLCFAGTVVMYVGWHQKFYRPDQMIPALLFTSLFYLMFLLIPTLHSLVRRLPERAGGLAILVLSAVLSFLSYYNVLFAQYRYILGFVVIAQALVVILLFYVWIGRVGMDSPFSASFLIIALGLVTIAIPIQLRLYGIPIAWSVEGGVLVFLGIRFRQVICKVAGLFALFLAAGGLLFRLPLHNTPFTPIFNRPFASWSFVIAMATLSAYLLKREKKSEEDWQGTLPVISFLLALSMACFLLSVEVSLFWSVQRHLAHYHLYETASLTALWSLIAVVIASILGKRGVRSWMLLSWISFGIGAVVLFTALEYHAYPSLWLMLNISFLPGLIFVLSLWWGARLSRRLEMKLPADVQSLAGHGILVIAVAFEFERWSRYSGLISPRMGISLISAAWAAQAFLVIWIGLAKRNPLLRYLGFFLFVLTVGKTVIIDMSELEKVYRIISFAASGLLLLAAGYFYQRYSSKILDRPDSETGK